MHKNYKMVACLLWSSDKPPAEAVESSSAQLPINCFEKVIRGKIGGAHDEYDCFAGCSSTTRLNAGPMVLKVQFSNSVCWSKCKFDCFVLIKRFPKKKKSESSGVGTYLQYPQPLGVRAVVATHPGSTSSRVKTFLEISLNNFERFQSMTATVFSRGRELASHATLRKEAQFWTMSKNIRS